MILLFQRLCRKGPPGAVFTAYNNNVQSGAVKGRIGGKPI